MKMIHIRMQGLSEYSETWALQRQFTEKRDTATTDELWCLQHTPVYTLGLAGKSEHILHPGRIPVHKTDRGGQVTYHGPGQLVIYPLLDLKRKGISIRNYVYRLEQAVIAMLRDLGLQANRKDRAPGVYVRESKIAALGIRVRRGCCYHGLSLNVAMDLRPFLGINPCGYPGLPVTQLADHDISMDVETVAHRLIPYLLSELDYTDWHLSHKRAASACAAGQLEAS